MPGEVDGNGLVELADVGPFVDALLTATGIGANCGVDVNLDGSLDGRDVGGFVELLVQGP